MTNTIIPEAEVNAVKKVIEAVEELKTIHSNNLPEVSKDELEAVHCLVFLHFVKELVGDSNTLKDLIDISREDFEKDITANGERTVSEALTKVMMHELLEALKD